MYALWCVASQCLRFRPLGREDAERRAIPVVMDTLGLIRRQVLLNKKEGTYAYRYLSRQNPKLRIRDQLKTNESGFIFRRLTTASRSDEIKRSERSEIVDVCD